MNIRRRRPFVMSCLLLAAALLITAVFAQHSNAQDDQPDIPDPVQPPDRSPIVQPDQQIEVENNPTAREAAAASAENVEFVGQIGGNVSAVAVMGNYAYVGEGPRLIILDISDPATPLVKGQTEPIPGVVRAVVVEGNYAYAAADQGGLRIIDISNKSAPVEVGFYDTPGYAEDVFVVGNHAYLASYVEGLFIIDISDPASPSEVAHYSTPGFAYGVTVVAPFAYIADGHLGLHIVDISDPSNPSEAGSFDTPEQSHDVIVVGSYAYVADGWGGLRIIEVSSPATAYEVGYYDSPGSAQNVVVDGNYAYVADYHGDLRIINIADAASPFLASTFYTYGNVGSVAKSGDTAYITLGSQGMRTVDVTNPTSPTSSGSYRLAGFPRDVVLRDNFAYVAGDNGGLLIIDISDPANPKKTGSFDDGYASAVVLIGDHAYLASANAGLRIIDISNPAAPYQVGIADTPSFARDVAVAGNYAYVADFEGDLRIIDITNANNPVEVSHLETPGDALRITVDGDIAYLSAGNDFSALLIIDVSDPLAPFLIRSFEPSGGANGLYKSGADGFLANNEGLLTLDFSDPENPAELGVYRDIFSGRDVDLDGQYAHLAAGYEGVRIVNVANLSAPTEVGSYDTPGYAYGVATDGIYSFVADGAGGLVILRNAAPGSITIGKLAEPADGTNFNFDGDLGSFTLQHGQKAIFDGLAEGDYTIREANINPWYLNTVTCNTSNVTKHVERVVVHLDPGKEVTCNFVNEPRPSKAENVEFSSHIGGATFATAVQGDYAFYGEGPQLVIVDISDPATANIVGTTPPLDGVVGAIDVSGGYAYVAARYSGLHIIDISDPTDPVEIGHLYTAGDAMDVAVAGNTVYLADSVGGMLIIDVSDPSAPSDLGSFGNGGEFSLSVATDESYAYYSDGWRLSVVEPSNPAEPVEIGYFEASAEKIHVNGTSLFIAGGSGLTIIDIVDPTSPVEISAYPTSGYSYDVAIDEDHAYITNAPYLTILDISDPYFPLWERDIELPDTSRNVDAASGFAYVATDTSGLRIFDLSQQPDSLEVASFDAPSLVIGAAVEGDYAYLSSGSAEGLQIVNISNAEEPAPVSYLDTHYAYQTAISGTVAYVADGIGLRIVEISDPNSPTEIGFLSTPGSASDVIVQGNYAYVVLHWDGIYIVDISDPNSPEEVVFYSVGSDISRLALVNNYAYVATTGGLIILDISDPGSPSEVGSFITGEPVKCVGIDEDLVVIGSGYGDVYLVDASDPTDPQEIGHFENKYTCRDIAVDGIFFYIISGWNTDNGGLQIFDISIPSAPVEVGHYQTAWSSGDVTIAKKGIYLADGWGGFYGLKFVGYGSITIEMLTEPKSTASFSFTGDLGDFSLVSGENKQFAEVLPGDLSVIEADRTGWYLDRVSCTGGDTSAVDNGVTIHLESGDDIHCTFVSRRYSVTADAGGPYSGEEGSYISLDASGSDHQEMIKEYMWDCANDGVFEKSSSSPTGKSCKYNDNGSYTIKLRTVDIFGKSSEDTAQATISNAAPTVDAGSDQTAGSGEIVSFSGSFFDPGTADTHTILWTFGDGASASGSLSPDHTYAKVGSYTVELIVMDDDGGAASDDLTVVVNNSPPEMWDITLSDDEIDEGESFVLSGSVHDDNPSSKLILLIDWGDGHEHTFELSAGSTTFSAAHTCIDDDPGGTTADSYTINLKLSDDEGAFSTATAEIKVNNVAPLVEAGPDQEAIKGEIVEFAAVISDVGAADTHTVSWDFGDGSAPVAGAEVTHSFAEQGTYTVIVAVEDDDGGIGQDSLTVEVKEAHAIYSPILLR